MTKKELKADEETILGLFKLVSPTGEQMETIFQLYKKYVNPNVSSYRADGCSACGNSIVVYWRGLMKWYNDNRTIFNV